MCPAGYDSTTVELTLRGFGWAPRGRHDEGCPGLAKSFQSMRVVNAFGSGSSLQTDGAG